MRIAKIIVDSAQLEYYKAALKEGIEMALNTERVIVTNNFKCIKFVTFRKVRYDCQRL